LWETALKIQSKILVSTLIIALSSTVVTALVLGWISYSSGRRAIQLQVEQQLKASTQNKRQQITANLKTMAQQVVTFSDNIMIVDAMASLKSAFRGYKFNPAFRDKSKLAEKKGSLKQFYDARAAQNKNKKLVNIDKALNDLSESALNLQYYYISANKNSFGQKDKLDKGADASRYSTAHLYYHPHLREYMERFGYSDIYLVDPDSGNVVYSVKKKIDFVTNLKTGLFAKTGLAEAFNKANKLTAANQYVMTDFAPYSPSFNAPESFIASPIYEKGQKIGIIVFEIPISKINNVMTGNKKWVEDGFGKTGESFLVGADGLMRSVSRFYIEHPKQYLVLEKKQGLSKVRLSEIRQQKTTVGIQPIKNKKITAALAGKSGFAEYVGYLGYNVISAYAPVRVNGLKWTIVSEMSKAEAFSSVGTLQSRVVNYSILVALIVVVIAALIALLMAKNISSPVVRFSTLLQNIVKRSDLTLRLQLKQKDEVGDMAKALNLLLERFQTTCQKIAETAQDVSSTSEVLSTYAGESRQAMGTQLSETQQAMDEMDVLMANVEEVSKNTSEAVSVTEQANLDASSGGKRVNEMIHNIGTISQGMENASLVINELALHSDSITQIVETIRTIAEQTNLLALNAAIEAARAGEQGRGFAVVADEVRGLAQRTQSATAEIQEMIAKLQQGSQNAVRVMGEEKSKIDQSVTEAGEAESSLNAIISAMSNIREATDEIQQAIQQQTSRAAGMKSSLDSASELANRASTSSENTAKSSADLARFSDQLHSLSQQWKV